MNTNKTLLYAFLISAIIACEIDQKSPVQQAPNIILISADDLGWSDLGCYGSEIKTPNLDRLAEGGMRLTHFHNTAKCFPSRASLITGVYAQDCGYAKTPFNSLQHAVTIGEVLQQAGYKTYWSGKHHGKDNPYNRGFDHYYGLKDGCCNYFNPGHQREGEKQPAQKRHNRAWCMDSAFFAPYTPPEADFYTTDYFTNNALDYISEADKEKQPFFLFLAYTAPHDPLMAWPEDIVKYKGEYDEGYASIRKRRYEKQQTLGLIDSTYQLSEPAYKVWDQLSDEKKHFEAQKMEVYAAMIDRMDQNIGRVLMHLKTLGMDDNTLIIFVSDNGASNETVLLNTDDDQAPVGSMERWVSLGKDWANVCNTPFRYFKNYSYQGGINTPLIAYWPDQIKPNSFSDFSGHFIDLMPTFVDIADANYPNTFKGDSIVPMRGISLLPVFRGETVERNGALFWNWNKGSAVRLGDWKIVKHGDNNTWDLFNLKDDPCECVNLADQYSVKVGELDLLYTNWIKRYTKD